jgi:hypothetical protein
VRRSIHAFDWPRALEKVTAPEEQLERNIEVEETPRDPKIDVIPT